MDCIEASSAAWLNLNTPTFINSRMSQNACGIFGCGNIATEKCPVVGCEMRLCSEHKFKHGHTYLDRDN
jgi:hypothetical protein